MNNLKYIIISVLVLFASCKKDMHSIIEIEPPDESEVFEESDLSGIVVDVNGDLLANATVYLGDLQTQTDENGVYLFKDALIVESGSLMTVQKPGYLTQYRFVSNQPGERSFGNVTMIEWSDFSTFAANDEAIIDLDNKTKIKFSSGSISNLDGSIYQGMVSIKAHWYDPNDPMTLSTMPGDLRGQNLEEEDVQLATLGMVKVELTDETNNELILNSPAEVSFYFGSNAPDPGGNGIVPLWHFNVITGVWEEESEARLEGEYYVGMVEHFSWWNCDYPYPLTCINGYVTDSDGNPLVNTEIAITEPNSLTCGTGTTNIRGYFEAKVPADQLLELSVNGCAESVQIGPFSGESNSLGNVMVISDLTPFTGTLVGCMGQALSSAYIIISQDNNTQLFYGDGDGNISGTFPSCAEGDWEVIAYDFQQYVLSDPLTIVPSGSEVELGEIELCNPIESFFSYDINGSSDNLVNPDFNVSILDGNQLVVESKDWLGDTYILLVAPNDPNIPRSTFKYNDLIAGSGSTDWTFDIDFEYFGTEVGSRVKGTYAFGAFDLTVTEVRETATIVVQLFKDTNANGLFDPTESPITSEYSITLDEPYESYYEIHTENSISDQNGIVQFSGLYPDTEYTLRYNANSYTVSDPNVGMDDTIDSDFELESGNSYTFTTETLTAGSIENTVAIGLR